MKLAVKRGEREVVFEGRRGSCIMWRILRKKEKEETEGEEDVCGWENEREGGRGRKKSLEKCKLTRNMFGVQQ